MVNASLCLVWLNIGLTVPSTVGRRTDLLLSRSIPGLRTKGIITTMTAEFPKMVEVRQYYPASPRLIFSDLLREQFARSGVLDRVSPGMRIALGVGSRGISNLAEIVKETAKLLKNAGAIPFLVPAMGSHGGATPEGQEKVLTEYGITPESMGVSFETSMEVRQVGSTIDGRDVVFSVAALNADGVIAINRVKPHTDFFGDLGSGLQKMLTIGFGKHVGAANAHRAASRLGHQMVISEAAKVILNTLPVLGGVAILEDQHHETATVEVIAATDIVEEERRLLSKARSLMSQLPFEEIDLLVIDQIGKEISGTGMDTNVIGRGVLGYLASLNRTDLSHPHILRIFVRELTATTNGNGIGIGLADFTTTRAVESLNLNYVYTNAITSLGLPTAKIPIYFDTDREVIKKAIASLATEAPNKLRIVRILNTLSLDRMLASEVLAQEALGKGNLTIAGTPREMDFDEAGNLLPF
jgi:hypothetical protein